MSTTFTLTPDEQALAEQYKTELQKRLKPKRYHHSLCVADAAVRLAQQYGYPDLSKAYFAGLLHDITKNDSEQQHKSRMQQYGYQPSDIEAGQEKLWHAKTGVLVLEHEFGITDREMLTAISYHTTARADMTPLEEILYLADFISDDRDYDGVEQMRQAAAQNKQTAMEIALCFTITDLVERRKPIHPDTLDAYNELCEKE